MSKLTETDSYKCCSNSYSETGSSTQESYRYFKIIQKLTQSSMCQPANVPILCTQSFNTTDSSWNYLSNQLCLKQSDFKLIILNKGEPVNAMFYVSDLDLIYVKTADDLEGFVPRSYCKLFSTNENNFNEYLKPVMIENSYNSSYNTNNGNKNYGSDHNESIKYHSLSSSEYDDLNEEHLYSNIPSSDNRNESPKNDTFLKPI